MQLLIKEQCRDRVNDSRGYSRGGEEDPDGEVDAELVVRLVEQARAAGRQPTGEGGLLQQLAKRFFRRRSSLRTVGSGVKPRLNR